MKERRTKNENVTSRFYVKKYMSKFLNCWNMHLINFHIITKLRKQNSVSGTEIFLFFFIFIIEFTILKLRYHFWWVKSLCYCDHLITFKYIPNHSSPWKLMQLIILSTNWQSLNLFLRMNINNLRNYCSK